MLGAMLRQSTGGGSGGGDGSGGGTKLPLGISRFSSSSSNTVTLGSYESDKMSKGRPMHSPNLESFTSYSNYIMQTVSDVRTFSDGLIQFRGVLASRGMFGNHALTKCLCFLDVLLFSKCYYVCFKSKYSVRP